MRTEGGSLLELPGLALLSVVFLDQCEIRCFSVRFGAPTVQCWQAGRKPPHLSLEPRPAVLLSMVNYSSVSGEEDEEAMEMGRG